MNWGAENRKQIIVLAVLGTLALLLLARAFFSPGPAPAAAPSAGIPSAEPAAPTVRARFVTEGKRSLRKAARAPLSIDPTLRYDWLKASEDTKYEGDARNIFMSQAEIPTPVAPAGEKEKEAAKGPPPPPPPPPINLKFYGFASRQGEAKRVFLSQGEDVFIAGEGDIVDRRYKILHIAPTSVEVEDVLYNNRQTLPLTQG